MNKFQAKLIRIKKHLLKEHFNEDYLKMCENSLLFIKRNFKIAKKI